MSPNTKSLTISGGRSLRAIALAGWLTDLKFRCECGDLKTRRETGQPRLLGAANTERSAFDPDRALHFSSGLDNPDIGAIFAPGYLGPLKNRRSGAVFGRLVRILGGPFCASYRHTFGILLTKARGVPDHRVCGTSSVSTDIQAISAASRRAVYAAQVIASGSDGPRGDRFRGSP